MKKISTWQNWLNGDGIIPGLHTRRINQAADELNHVEQMQSLQGDSMAKLFELDRRQADEIRRLRAAVHVLTTMLIDSKALDEKVFGYRMDAALADLEEEDAPGDVNCSSCGAHILLAQSNMTENGTVCDACFANQPR